jgi:large subunit ribosomal protein L24
MKIKKGDKVKVIAGDDKGVVAEVLAALPRSNRVIVEGVNVVKRHSKPSNANPDGGIINKELPISVSNVRLAEAKKAKKTAKKTTKKETAKKEPAKKAAAKKKSVKGEDK